MRTYCSHFFFGAKNVQVTSNDMFWLLNTFHVSSECKTLAIYGGRSFLTRFIYLTFVSTPLQCFQCFYMSLMFFQPDFWCLMFFLWCFDFSDFILFSPAPMFSLFRHSRWNGDKSSQIFPQQTHVETKLLLCYLCCCWEIFRQRFSAAVLPPPLPFSSPNPPMWDPCPDADLE